MEPTPPNIEPTSPISMQPVEDPDELQDEPIHDQLPSVEEAKANVELEGSSSAPKRSRCRFCFYSCACICCGLVLLIILILLIPQMIGVPGKAHSSQHNGPNTLPPGTFESRVDYVRNFLSAFSDEGDLTRVGSPQYRASKWIADEDVLHLPIDYPTFVERYALAVFYYSTGGP